MQEYSICNNYLEIIAGTTNTIVPAYTEAAKNIDKDTPTGMGYLKNFITSIEALASKDSVKDERIAKSRGNVKNFAGYENIKFAIQFLNKNLSGIDTVKDCVSVFDALENYQALFTDAYDKNVRLVIMEYESALYLLVTSLSMVMANNMDVVANGTEIRIQKKNATTFGIIPKTMKDLAKQMKDRNHKDYLENIIKGVDSVQPGKIEESTSFTESAILDTLELIGSVWNNLKKGGIAAGRVFKAVKNSLFGIVPLIRSIIYLRYKKKADTIIALEQQVVFIQRNIEQLQNIKTMDAAKKAEIIKKQQAICEQYKKKAEKLRAQLCEGEKAAAVEIKKEDPKIKNTDDDFVLENGKSVVDIFTEAGSTAKRRHVKRLSGTRSDAYVAEVRKDKFMDRFTGSGKHVAKSDTPTKDAEKLVQRAMDDLFNETKLKSIRLTPGTRHDNDDPKKRTATKLGGIPYWPQGMDYPQYKGSKLIMLAQLNFKELPKLENFPSSGIMQFFVSDADVYDVNGTEQIRVVYHPEILPQDKWEEVAFNRTTLDKKVIDAWFPIRGVYYPTAKLEEVGMNISDDVYFETLCKHLNKHFKTDWKYWRDIPTDVEDLIWKLMPKNYGGCRVGGHPYFVQGDVRSSKNPMFETLLLELDSEAGMMWGDCGVANFFASKTTLKSKKFDRSVYYTWDCC